MIVDVREVKELKASGEVPGAKNIPLSVFKLAFDLKEDSFHEQYDAKVPAPNDPIITFCLSGVRSEMARSILVDELGYENVANFEGSFAEWSNKKRN